MRNGFFSNRMRRIVAVFCILMPIMALWVSIRRVSPTGDTRTAPRDRGDSDDPTAPPPLVSDSAPPAHRPPEPESLPVTRWHPLDLTGLAPDGSAEAVHGLLSEWRLQTVLDKGVVRVHPGEVEQARLALRLADPDSTGAAWTLSDITVTAGENPRLHRLQTWLAGRDTLLRMLPLALGMEGIRIRVEPSDDPYAGCVVRILLPGAGGELSNSDRIRLRQHVESLLAPVKEMHIGEETPPDADSGSATLENCIRGGSA